MKISATTLKPILLIMSVAALIRLFNINTPFVEPFNNISRQAMCASVARNYWKEGFNLFRPSLDQGGPGFNLYNVELPVNTYLMSFAYYLTGGPHEGAARSVSVGFSLMLIFYAYLLIRRISDSVVASWTAAVIALSPMSVALSRSIQPDIAMVALMTASFYYFYVYLDEKKYRFIAVSSIMLFLAVLVRPFALLIFLPMVYAAIRMEGVAAFRNIRYYTLLLACLGLIWYLYMWHYGKTHELYYSPYRGDRGDLAEGKAYWTLFTPGSLKLNIKASVFHILTPLGIPLFLIGLFQNPKTRGHAIMWSWMTASLAYLWVMWPTAVYHPYYLFPLLPVQGYFIGLGAIKAASIRPVQNLIRCKWPVVLLLTFEVLCVGYYYRLLYFAPEERMKIVRTGLAVQELTSKDDLVVASWGGSPIQLYYTDRKGWGVDPESKDTEALISELENLRHHGARWYAVANTSEIKQNQDFVRYLKDGFRVVRDDKDSFIVDLSA